MGLTPQQRVRPPLRLREVAVRMVVPMRREFGHELDVGQLLRDARYARSVALSALSSDDARLQHYGRLLAAALSRPQRQG